MADTLTLNVRPDGKSSGLSLGTSDEATGLSFGVNNPLMSSENAASVNGGIFWIQTMPDDENSEARVLNKTYNEIKNAFDNGLLPIASVTALYPDDQYETTIMYFRGIGKKINNNVMHYIVDFVLESTTAGVMTFITTDPDSYLKSITDEEIAV